MNAFLRKEVRLLLPTFLIGLLLVSLIWLLPREPAAPGLRATLGIFIFLSPVLLVMMTLAPFGRELSCGTFPNLLAQPVLRARVWWTKTLLLAIATALLFAVWWSSLAHNLSLRGISAEHQRETFLITLLFVIAAYSGGLWTILLLRQVAAAFWFTLLTPAMIMVAVVHFFDGYHETDPEKFRHILIVAFSIYSLGGFWFARHLFLRAQDVQWTGGTIALALPNWRARRQAGAGSRHEPRFRPRRALLAREFQLHQSQFVLAGVLLLSHLGLLALRQFGGLKPSLLLDFANSAFWTLWLFMPLLVGCAAVAEERKLGTLEAQLCLPTRRRTQFLFKFMSTLLLSVLLGTVVPLLLEGGRILPDLRPDSSNGALLGGPLEKALPVLALAGIAAAIGAVSFYASTFSRNTLQSLAPAVLGTVFVLFLIFVTQEVVFIDGRDLWGGGLVYLIGGPVMTLAVVRLMYWNFKHVLVGWNVWRRNGLVLLGSLAFVLLSTTAIRYRAWELLLAQEPPHGAARLTSAQVVSMKSDGATVLVQLSEGQVWAKYLPAFVPVLARVEPKHGAYVEGTNWAAVARCQNDFVGVQNDGSLWTLSRPEIFHLRGLGRPAPASPPPWVRMGAENDWKRVVSGASQAFLLKTNGTLWRLGTNGPPGKQPWPGLAAFTPQRLGEDSDWAEISLAANGRTLFRKRDGQVWVFPPLVASDEGMSLAPDLSIHRAAHLEEYRSVVETMGPWGIFGVGVHEDGTFRVNAVMGRLPGDSRSARFRLVREDFQLGTETNWAAVAGNFEATVTLRADGTLWKWNFQENPGPRHQRRYFAGASPVQVGTHSDWIAVASAMDGIVSLAADGTLWFWQFRGPHFSRREGEPLLAPSRRPQLVGALFGSP